MWIDSHCHLDFSFGEPDKGEQFRIIGRARGAGVVGMINAGDTVESSRRSVELARNHRDIWAAIGVHPNEALSWSAAVEAEFLRWIKEDRQRIEASGRRIVAIGEIGLDYFRDRAPKDVQEKVFREQLDLAKKVDLPVVIHCRDAFPDAIRILEEEGMGIGRVVFHCYTGDLAMAKKIWEKGWLTSFSAIVGYPKNDELRRVVAACPDNLYLLETDAPFLPPQNKRGQCNEPAWVKETGKVVAEVRGEQMEAVAHASTTNGECFFDLKLGESFPGELRTTH